MPKRDTTKNLYCEYYTNSEYSKIMPNRDSTKNMYREYMLMVYRHQVRAYALHQYTILVIERLAALTTVSPQY